MPPTRHSHALGRILVGDTAGTLRLYDVGLIRGATLFRPAEPAVFDSIGMVSALETEMK
jgi:hypothetical protein